LRSGCCGFSPATGTFVHHPNLNSEEMIYYVFGNLGYADAEVIRARSSSRG
jgi:hypothetical protein